MAIMMSRRRLEDSDLEVWQARVESGTAERKAAGCRGVRRFRGIEDRHEVLLIFDWDTAENAMAFVASKVSVNQKLAERREDGGLKLENIFMEELPPLEN